MSVRVHPAEPGGTVEGPIEAGLDAIRAQFHVPGAFPDDVLAAADDAARRRPGRDHVDRTSWAFRTLDPAGSTDLDQAFFIDAAAGAQGGDLVLHYAIADVDFFVDPGGPIDHEAWARGETIYLPDRRSTLYPPALCEAAASLLPDGPRPAVVFTVRVAADGTVHLDGVERAVVHSRAKLAYDAIDAASIPGFAELSRRIVLAEDRRGAPRVEFPEQELTPHRSGLDACGSRPASRARTRTPACRSPRTWRWPTPSWRRGPGCSG